MMKRGSASFAIAALLALGQGSACAQADAPMKPAEVTEDAFADAFVDRPPEASSARSRGFSPFLRPVARKGASAAVLITFVTDSAELTGESRAALDTIARALRGDRLGSLNFVVEGHA